MSDIYVFGPNDDDNDYSSFGLVGAILPTEATFNEAGNGDSSVSITCPIDEFGRYASLVKGNILLCPVPVRTTPEIQNGSCVTTVWTYKVKPLDQLTSKKQRTLYKKQKGSSRLKIMNAGDIVTVVLKPTSSSGSEERWKVKSKYGTGWIIPDGFELITEKKIDNNANAIQEVQSPWSVQPQRFRIYEVEKTIDEVTVQARHISYDLLYNLTTYKSDESVTLQTALDGVLNNCVNRDHGFTAYTNVANEQAGLAYDGKNPIDAMLDPEEGLCAKYKVNLIRDNDELFFLNDPGMNRGVKIAYGKNMTGVTYTQSDDQVSTRIMPVGENKDGTPLYLSDNPSERFVDSNKINNYPIIHVYRLDCDNCKVGQKDSNGSKVTVAVARARMRKQAEDLLKTGVDNPIIKMEVEFVNLGDTEEYNQFKNLENCFLYDYLIIQHGKQDINVTAQIQEIEWDILTDTMKKVTIGTVGETLANMGITTWQIPVGFSGSKIANGTLGGGALRSDAIATRHLQADSVNASVIAAHSITADRLDATTVNAMTIEAVRAKINELVAGQITTDQLYVDLAAIAKAQITSANIKEANIDWATINTLTAQIATVAKAEIAKADIAIAQIDGLEAKIAEITIAEISKATIHSAQIDDLEATTAEIVNAKIANAEIDGAQIKDATIGTAKIALGAITAALIEAGAIGTAQIADGSITEAKIVSLNADVITAGTLSVDRLLIKGPNGLFRAINATDEGLTVEELSEEQYQNGMSGTVIVARSITADKIAAKSITANEILSNTITAAEINVANLFADEATIAALDAYLLKASTIEALEGKLDIWASDKITLAVKDKADSSDLTALEGRVNTAESTITQQAEEIEARVTKTTYDSDMANKADKNDLDNLTTRVSTAESNITQNSEKIETKVSTITYNDGMAGKADKGDLTALEGRVSTAETSITQNATTIATKASQSDFDALGNRVTAAESEIEQTPNKISAAVNGVKIGGTNLLHGISVWGIIDGEGFWYDSSGASAMGTYVAQNDGSLLVTNSGSNLRISHSSLTVRPSEVYTVSAEYKDVSGECPHQFQMVFQDSSGEFVGNAVSEGDKTTLADGWVKSVFTFTIPEGTAKLAPLFRSGTDYTLYTHQYYIRHPKLERGNKATDWSPNPNELRDVRVGSNILMDTEHTEISTPYLDIDVSGTEGDMHIDENGISAGTATFKVVNCPYLVKASGGTTYTGGLQEAFDAMNGRFLTGNVTISLSADQYGTFMLKGVYGVNASINIVGNGHSINGALAVYNCKLTNVGIGDVTINGSGASTPLALMDAGYVSVIGATINGGGSGKAVDANYGTLLMMYNTGLYNANNLIRLGHCTEGSFVQLRGGNCTNYLRADGARWTMSGTRPDGTYAQENTCLHAPENPDSLTIDYGTSQPSVTPVTTESYTANVTGTYYPSGHWINDNTIRQGHEGTGSNGRKDYGCMWFDAGALAGKTIKSATLTIKRISGKGRSSSVTLKLWTTTLTGKSGKPTDSIVSLGEIGKIANGETATFNVPTSAISVIASGGGLVLYTEETTNKTGKTYSENYAHFEGVGGSAPVLTVTYQ